MGRNFSAFIKFGQRQPTALSNAVELRSDCERTRADHRADCRPALVGPRCGIQQEQTVLASEVQLKPISAGPAFAIDQVDDLVVTEGGQFDPYTSPDIRDVNRLEANVAPLKWVLDEGCQHIRFYSLVMFHMLQSQPPGSLIPNWWLRKSKLTDAPHSATEPKVRTALCTC